MKPRRASDSIRFTLAQLSRFFEWRDGLTVVKPDTLIRWPSAYSSRSSEVDRRNGSEQSDLGRRTDRK